MECECQWTELAQQPPKTIDFQIYRVGDTIVLKENCPGCVHYFAGDGQCFAIFPP